MNYNYHTHTHRCSHASGSEEEYIQKAIASGIKFMGFSDHAPFVFPDGFESSYRVPLKDAEKYVSELKILREKYKNDIEIVIGYEMEYYPEYFSSMLNSAIESGAEYLILGQHFIGDECTDGMHTTAKTDSVTRLNGYVNAVLEAIKSGVFTYIAHPDVLNFYGDESAYNEEMRKICVASREYNIPLEINFLGIRYSRRYPDERFWKLAGEEKSPVVFGFDAHDVDSAGDSASLIKAKELVLKYNLNYIGKPEIRFLNKN